MGWIAGVFGIFLFYQFVERSHKIIVAKVSVVLVLLAGVGAGGYWAFRRASPVISITEDLTIEYNHHSDGLDLPGDEKEIRALWAEYIKENFFLWQEIRPENQKKVMYTIFPLLADKQFNLETIGNTSAEWDAMVDSWKKGEEGRAGAERLSKLKLERARNFVSALPSLRFDSSNSEAKILLNIKIQRVIDSLDKDALKLVKDALLPEEQDFIKAMADTRGRQEEKLRNRIDQMNLPSELYVKVCNKKPMPLKNYSFNVAGFERGRSTSHPLRDHEYEESSFFSSDIIVPPKECTTISYTGKMHHFDRYEVSGARGEW